MAVRHQHFSTREDGMRGGRVADGGPNLKLLAVVSRRRVRTAERVGKRGGTREGVCGVRDGAGKAVAVGENEAGDDAGAGAAGTPGQRRAVVREAVAAKQRQRYGGREAAPARQTIRLLPPKRRYGG